MRIANRNARDYTWSRQEFKGSNLFAEWVNEFLYVVYSYGKHWPLFIYDDRIGKWIGNHDKYSRSTSRHWSQAHPGGEVQHHSIDEITTYLSMSGVRSYEA